MSKIPSFIAIMAGLIVFGMAIALWNKTQFYFFVLMIGLAVTDIVIGIFIAKDEDER